MSKEKKIDKKNESALSVYSPNPPSKRKIRGTDSPPIGRADDKHKARDEDDKRIEKIDSTQRDLEESE